MGANGILDGNISVSLSLMIYKWKALLADKLWSDAFSLSLTTDIWTSSCTEAYFLFICHFLALQWEIVDCVLVKRSFPDHHTGENISSTVKEITEIADRTVSSIVHDQST